MTRSTGRSFVGVALLVLAIGRVAAAGTLVINANTSDPAPRVAWEAVVARFRADNPDIEIRLNVYDHESYKRSIRNWLTSAPPDVVFWFAGNRMRQLAALGLLADLSELFTPEVRAVLPPAAVDLVALDGREYGVPYAFYQVGLYFRRDLLEEIGIPRELREWDDLLGACDKLRAAGIEPFAIGSKDLWPVAGWFDYLDLRLNGYAFHMELMAGRVPYTDERVRAVFARWRELLDRGCFVENHASMSWQESQALLYQGRAAMMLIGNFIVPNFPPELRDRMDFVPFPALRADMGRYEEAPMNSLHVPARATNQADAKRFVAYVLRADVQEALAKALLLIPVNMRAALAEDRFLAQGRELLSRADALTQYFDRDTNEELALVAMKGFQEFMLRPGRLDAVLASIEEARKRIYGP